MKAANDFRLGVPPAVLRALLVRLAMLLVFAVSTGLIWWSVSRLGPLGTRLEEQSARIAAIENDILQTELRWDPAEQEKTEKLFRQANAQLFSGPDEFQSWQDEIEQSQAGFFRVSFTVEPGETRASPFPNTALSTTLATIDLAAIPDETSLDSPYERLVELARTLTTQEKRVDLLDLSASGNSNSVSRARLRVQVWSHEDMAANP